MQDKNIALNARLGSGYAWLVWVLGVLFVILLFAMQTGYAISSPYLQNSIGLKIAEIGIAASIYTGSVFILCLFDFCVMFLQFIQIWICRCQTQFELR